MISPLILIFKTAFFSIQINMKGNNTFHYHTNQIYILTIKYIIKKLFSYTFLPAGKIIFFEIVDVLFLVNQNGFL